jgi:voltage-gated potassium channel
MLRLALLVTALVLLYALLPFTDADEWWIGAVVGILAIIGLVPFTIRRVRAIRTAEHPLLVALDGLVLLLTLTILGFAGIYLTINRGGDQFSGLDTRLDAVYFTVTTFATVGFGDIVAIGQKARGAVLSQMIVDVLVIGVAAKVFIGALQHRVGQGR